MMMKKLFLAAAMFAAGAVPLRIGNWTLRVETAAIAGLGVLNVLMNLD